MSDEISSAQREHAQALGLAIGKMVQECVDFTSVKRWAEYQNFFAESLWLVIRDVMEEMQKDCGGERGE